VIGLPPSLDGGVNATDALVAVGVADTPVGAPGTVVVLPVVKAGEGLESGLAPTALVAVTVQVYVRAALSAVTVIGLAEPVPVRVVPPSLLAHVAV
jgi:hypothetical protein